jgi:hypothetical protein
MKINILIILCFLTLSCSAQKKPAESAESFVEISFGSGGGFTGLSKNFLLKSNGKVYRSVKDKLVKTNKISKSDIQRINTLINDQKFYDINCSEKGNMTYFIEIKSADRNNKVSWTETSNENGLKDLYKELVKTLNP